MQKKIHILFYSSIALLLLSCNQKPTMQNYQTEKFNWDGDATAPEGYPMKIITPNYFILSNNYYAFIPNGSYMEDGWAGSRRSWATGERNKPLPDSLKIAWFSYTENTFYQGDFKMPQEKIYTIFKEGYLIDDINWDKVDQAGNYVKELHKETYNALTVGLAPGGMVVVWASGQNKIEIGRFQAEETDFDWTVISKGSRAVSVRERRAEMSADVQQEIAQGTISSKRWDDYRLRYPWKIELNQEVEMYHYYMYFLNSENIGNPPSTDQAAYNKIILEPTAKAVPSEFGLLVQTANNTKHEIRIDALDEQETMEAFRRLYQANPAAAITMYIAVDKAFSTATVTLKNGINEIPLQKATIIVFKL